MVGTLAISAVFWGVSRYISVEVKVEELEEKSQNSTGANSTQEGADEEEDDDQEETVFLFLPTGFSRPRPQTFYKGSDPEWQEFSKVASDRPRVERIRSMFSQVSIMQEILTIDQMS
jgi:hypothetical protein